MAWKAAAVAVIIIGACLLALRRAAEFLVDWLWFSAVGYPDVSGRFSEQRSPSS